MIEFARWLYLGGVALLIIVVAVKAIEEIKRRLGGWKPEQEVNRKRIEGHRLRGVSGGAARAVAPKEAGQGNFF